MIYILAAQIGLAVWLFKYFATNERGTKEPRRVLITVCWLGILSVVAAGFVNEAVVPSILIEGGASSVLSIVEILGIACITGIVEELLKYVPVATYVFKKKSFDELTDGVVYFALAGMWFGVIENISYTLIYGGATGIVRLIMTPFLHAGFTALAGTGLARYKFVTHKHSTVIVWLILPIFLHAAYDFVLFIPQGWPKLIAIAIAIVVNLSVFKLYMRMRTADQAAGRSANTFNAFCHSCGRPNPEHYLYCSYCGKKT